LAALKGRTTNVDGTIGVVDRLAVEVVGFYFFGIP